MSRRRTTPATRGVVVSWAAVVLVAAFVAAVLPGTAATAADRGALRTTITSVSPTRMTDDSKVTLAGRVTNVGKTPWTDAQAYLVVRPTPLGSRADLADAISTDAGYAGPRVVDAGLFDEIGDLPPGASRSFRVSVPAGRLPISGADGVYPVGVQILATDADGGRTSRSVSRAVTLLPHMSGDHASAPTTVVWPFFMPVGRAASGRLMELDTMLTAIRPGGRLRNLLDLAMSRDEDGRGVIVDPALVLATDTLAAGRGAPDVAESDRRAAARFRDDLVAIGSGPSAWVLDFDRTDVLSLVGDAARRRRLLGAVERATESVVQEFGLSGRRVSWPVSGGVTRTLLATLRARGDDPVVVNSSDLSRWQDTAGSLVEIPTPGGDLPLLVNDDLVGDLPGTSSGATLRQEVLASSAFASLSRDADPGSRAAAVVVVDPFWNPRSDDPVGPDSAAWTAPFSTPTDLAAVARDATYTGSVPRTTDAKVLPAALLAAADRAYRAGDLLGSASDDNEAVDDARSRSVAGVLGVRWHTDPAAGTALAREVSRRVTTDLRSISVMGPTAVTLSSSEGGFPLTITNNSKETVSVGVRLSSSNPALQLPEQAPVEIAAGERLTTTVEVDLRQQNATTVTAQLVTPDGRAFGTTSEFNVRSSSVGVVLWATMAAAGLFVLVALARRFGKRRSSRPATPSGADDD